MLPPPAIDVRNLSKNYGGVAAVCDVSFRVDAGELVGFLGLNGAGKTTTMRILTTYLPASSGVATVGGYDVLFDSLAVRQQLGYLPESVPLPNELRVEEYLRMRAELKQVARDQRTHRVDYCVDRTRIGGVRRRLIGTLSKGYRQRVGLADALLSDPKVLILDEPLSGLDPLQQDETLKAIRELKGQHTVLFSSHQLADVEKTCDRVIIIHRGKLQYDGTLAGLAKRSNSAVVIVELKAGADAARKSLGAIPGTTLAELTPLGEGWLRASVQVADGRDLREQVNRVCAEHGWGVRSLQLQQTKLEEAFFQVATAPE